MEQLEGKRVKITEDTYKVLGQYEQLHLLGMTGTITEANERLVTFRPDDEDARDKIHAGDSFTWVLADVEDANFNNDKNYDTVPEMISDWVKEA